jgi:malate synthase
MSKPICELIKTLNPGTKLSYILAQGAQIQVSMIVNYNDSTRLVTFINNSSNTVIVDCEDIAAIEFDNQ